MDKHFFDPAQLPDRRHTNCVKWDTLGSKYGREDLLPLWVADMDFPAPPCIREALRRSVDHGIFGYYAPPESYYDAFIAWEQTRHQVNVQREWLRFSPGVVAGLAWLLSALTAPGDAAAILTPCYYPFMEVIRDTGRRLVCSELVPTADGGYTVDLEDLEARVQSQQVKALILCSPHNPVGHVWREAELLGILELCRRHGVLVISDEIHQDLVYPGHTHLSCLRFQPYLDRIVMLTSASKTFNIAGLQNSFVVIPHKALRDAFDGYVKTLRAGSGSSLGYVAAEAGYAHGGPWLDEVLACLQGNYVCFRDTLLRALPALRIAPLESTYLAWVDLSAYVTAEHLVPLVQDQARLAVDYGFWFWPEGRQDSDAHIRINLAASRETLTLAAERLIAAIQALPRPYRQHT